MNRLTVAVIMAGDTRRLRACLDALAAQWNARAHVVVPADSAIIALAPLYPDFEFLNLGDLPCDAVPGTEEARGELFERRAAAALRACHTAWIALIQDWCPPAPDWLANAAQATAIAHAAAVGGAIADSDRGCLHHALYLQDFGRYAPPLQPGPAASLSDANVLYRIAALHSIQHLWSQRYNEIVVHNALRASGQTLWLEPSLLVIHDRGCIRLGAVLAERFASGRLYGAVRARHYSHTRRIAYAALSPLIVASIVLRAAHLGSALPALGLLALAWTAGEVRGVLTSCRAAR